MSRRLLAALLGGVVLTGGLTGCGIPASTDVQVDGPGPAVESGSNNGVAAEPPPPTASDKPEEFIENYLSAAAGEREQAYHRAKQFVAPEARSQLSEKQNSTEIAPTVVRVKDIQVDTRADTTSTATVEVQQVGVLRADGTLAPPVTSVSSYRFALRPADTGDTRLLITELPNVLLLSGEALGSYYREFTVYFWNSDETRLVPDLRYLPRAVPAERQVTEIVRWLTGGPSDWLSSAVTGLPDGTRPINNATGSGGRWEVNLTMPGANDARLAKLATQLAWSLNDRTGQLELKIQNQKRLTVDLKQERQSNPAYPVAGIPRRYGVYDGAIHPLSFGGEPSGSVPVAAEMNKRIVSAGLSRSGEEILAALVVDRADRRQRLLVGFGPDPVSEFQASSDWYGSMGRPVWLRSRAAPRYGLVVADGKLYRFDETADMRELGVPGKVTGVAPSLDGHRIALIIDGALHVAAASLDGGALTVGQPRRLATQLTDVSAVDWTEENELVYAGSEERRPVISKINVDGAVDTALHRDTPAPRVTHLSAYPAGPIGTLPVGAPPTGSYMYEANKVAYRSDPHGKIEQKQVLDVPPAAAGARKSNLTVPFFLY